MEPRALTVHVDANILIRLLGGDKSVIRLVRSRTQSTERVSIASIAWFEFLCGSAAMGISDVEIQAAESLISEVHPIGKSQSELAARLFNQTGRRRSSKSDCLIASSAIHHNALLLTCNRQDFARFEVFGLRLAIP